MLIHESIKIIEQHPEEIRQAIQTKRECLDSVKIPNGSLTSFEFGSDVVNSSGVSVCPSDSLSARRRFGIFRRRKEDTMDF
jgi:hypothetical protein